MSFAQAPTTDPLTLAKYDTNKNGRLEPEEIAAMQAARGTPAVIDNKSADQPVILSPFEVVSQDRGYYASSTMSGTRLNSKVEDLASSISVVTKEQMSDFAMLDINDIFLYEAGTEGTGTYTQFEVDRNGSPTDNSLNPQGSNRVRGIGSANLSFGNVGLSGLTPVDPLNIEGVELSRGPNANVFGLGSAGGTLNLIPATANPSKDRTQVGSRADSLGGYRFDLDANRVAGVANPQISHLHTRIGENSAQGRLGPIDATEKPHRDGRAVGNATREACGRGLVPRTEPHVA